MLIYGFSIRQFCFELTLLSHTLGQVCLLVKVIQGLDSYAFIVNFEKILVYWSITSLPSKVKQNSRM